MKNLNEVVIGTKVTGNWGAMIAIDEGVVVSIIKSVSGVSVPPVAVVKWEYESGRIWHCDYKIADIKNKGETSVNGSPIGVYIDDSLQEWLTKH